MVNYKLKIKRWIDTQADIVDQLQAPDRHNTTITIPHGLQPANTLRHNDLIKCHTYYCGADEDIFVTHHGSGPSNQVSAWHVNPVTKEAKVEHFDVRPNITVLIYITKLKVFVGFCSDLTIRVFDSLKRDFSEISITLCRNSILSLAYNRDTEELYAAGVGCLLRYKLGPKQARDKLALNGKFELTLTRDQWVTMMMVDNKHKRLLALTDDAVFVFNYMTGALTHHLMNRHNHSLTSCCFYKPFDYFITAARDGSLKVWNALVFAQMFEFMGHYEAITGLMTHPTEPILISASHDGSVRMWRLDTFEQYQRLDVGEKVLSMRLLNSHELYFATRTQLRLWKLNMFHTLYSPIQASVHKMQRYQAEGRNSRILVASEDGGVRVLCPSTGCTLTIVYPMPDFSMFHDILMDLKTDRLYALLPSGQVLVLDCSTNPCSACCLLVPESPDEHILSLALVKLDLAVGAQETKYTEHIIFAGHKNGQISLLSASKSEMPHNIQAHHGEVTTLAVSHQLSSSLTSSPIGMYDRLLSGSTDCSVKVWEIRQSQTSQISLCPLKLISLQGTPTYICMLGNILALSHSESSTIFMYELYGKTERDGVMLLDHSKEDDHSADINGLSVCANNRIFATSSQDGLLKIWNWRGELLREMQFDNTLNGASFINTQGDILVGYQNHLHVVPMTNYLPIDALEKMVLMDFPEDPVEDPIPFDHDVQLWFDASTIQKCSASLNTRKLEEEAKAKEAQHVAAGDGLHVTDDNVTVEKEVAEHIPQLSRDLSQIAEEITPALTSDSTAQQTTLESGVKKSKSLSDKIKPKPSRSTGKISKARSEPKVKSTKSLSREYNSYKSEKIQTTKKEERMVELKETVSAENDSVTEMDTKAKDDGDDAKGKEEEIVKEEVKKVEEKPKKFYPIAPDGYIPNSVVRSLLNFKPPPDIIHEQAPWKLKPVPQQNPKHQVHFADSEISSQESLHEPLLWDTVDDEEEIEVPTPRETSASSHVLEKDEEAEVETEMSKPRNLKNQIKIAKRDVKKIDMDFSRVKKTGVGKKAPPGGKGPKAPRTRPVAGIAEEEEEEEQPDKEEEDHLPEYEDIPELIQEIIEQPWFPKGAEPTTKGVTEAFIGIMDNVGVPQHKQLCSYIPRLKNELDLAPELLDQLIDKLREQLKHPVAGIRMTAVRTLEALGLNRREIIMDLLPMLIDDHEEISKAGLQALQTLTGIKDKDSLLHLLQDADVNPPFSSKADEELTDANDPTLKDAQRSRTKPSVKKKARQRNTRLLQDGRQKSGALRLVSSPRTQTGSSKTPADDSKSGPTDATQAQFGSSRTTSFTPGRPGMKKEHPDKSDQAKANAARLQKVRLPQEFVNIDLDSDKDNASVAGSEASRSSVKRAKKKILPHDPAMHKLYSKKKEVNQGTHEDVISSKDSLDSSPKLRRLRSLSSPPKTVNTEFGEFESDSESRGFPAPPNTVQQLNNSLDSNLDTLDRTGKVTTKENLRDSQGRKIDSQRRLIDSQGMLIDSQERLIDSEGGLIDTQGQLTISNVPKGNQRMKNRLLENTDTESDAGIGSQKSGDLSNNMNLLKIQDDASVEDSGIGQMSDVSSSYPSYNKTSLINRGIPQLSTVKSVNGMDGHTSPPPENWREFFEHPAVQEHRKMALVKKDFDEGRTHPLTLPPIKYLTETDEKLPAESGLRLLHTVAVDKDVAAHEKAYYVDPMPAKLGVSTRLDDEGNVQYGILNMKWTTGQSSSSGTNSGNSSNRITNFPKVQKVHSPPSIHSGTSKGRSLYNDQVDRHSATSKSFPPVFLPKLQNKPKDGVSVEGKYFNSDCDAYQWDTPLPPPPPKESRMNNEFVRKQHHHYCDYYNLVKKKMHLHTSISRYLNHKATVNKLFKLTMSGDNKQAGVPS
ncbi:unnamed protein product [Owenia fusiformis]|uniref:Uncharacterized protein n=1 Tax=Owenia fusiformis TaxID=6347 RepID=A0A8S4P2E2_OWEFU|nr:unnamed protein product [Owenia fusiformis]